MKGLLQSVDAERAFYLVNGRVLKNLHELSNALISMDDATYSHHVNKERNDFSAWILGVFNHPELARDIGRLKRRELIARRLNHELKHAAKEAAKEAERETKAQEDARRVPIKSAPIAQAAKPIAAPKQMKEMVSNIKRLLPTMRRETKAVEHKEDEIIKKLDLVLSKEKEIEFKEKKLLEIEQRIEHKLGGVHDPAFFTKEFVQGLLVGFLLTVIGILIYVKFIAPTL